jgi:secreted trypsin-like serine protease
LDTKDYKIIPVCVPAESSLFQGDVLPGLGYATGFGAKKEGGASSTDLMEVALPLLSDAACKAYYKSLGIKIDTLTQVCAGIAGNNKDTCQGDSGGPLVSKSADDGLWYLFGITSFGIGWLVYKFIYLII